MYLFNLRNILLVTGRYNKSYNKFRFQEIVLPLLITGLLFYFGEYKNNVVYIKNIYSIMLQVMSILCGFTITAIILLSSNAEIMKKLRKKKSGVTAYGKEMTEYHQVVVGWMYVILWGVVFLLIVSALYFFIGKEVALWGSIFATLMIFKFIHLLLVFFSVVQILYSILVAEEEK